jgi:hypothetical protein
MFLMAMCLIIILLGNSASGLSACSDFVDNDGDGLVDFLGDPGCESINDNNEIDPVIACTNGAVSLGSSGKANSYSYDFTAMISGTALVLAKGDIQGRLAGGDEYSLLMDGAVRDRAHGAEQDFVCTYDEELTRHSVFSTSPLVEDVWRDLTSSLRIE